MSKRPKKKTPKHSPEQVTAEQALEKMKSFGDRREKFIAAVKKSKD